jgi:DNA-binding MarR family transcriptional regulator
VSLNINTTSSKVEEAARRRQLADAVLDEILSWNPREFISAFRRWHRDSFSLIHLNVLTLLDTDGPDSMSRLAEALDVSVASMTGIVDRMEKRGLVERRHAGEDRRVVLVYPTDAGRDVFLEIDRRRGEGLRRLLGQLSDEELTGLLTGHRALRQARAAAGAARTADRGGATPSDSPAAATPPGLHPPSTIPLDDTSMTPGGRPNA